MPSLMATLGGNIAPFVRSLENAKARAAQTGGEIAGGFGGQLTKSLAGFASVAVVEQAIQRTVEYGSKVNDLALRLGISTDAVQQWDHALKLNGSNIDAGAKFLEKLGVSRQKALQGNEEAIASFQKFGITLQTLSTTSVDSLGATIARAFESGNPQELIGALREVGGRGAGEMIAAFRSGMADAMKSAPLISPEDIAALDDLGDKWQEIKSSAMAAIAGPIVGLMNLVQGLIFGFERLVGVVVGAVGGFATHLGNVFDRLKSGDLLGLFKQLTVGGVKDVFGGAADTLQALNDADALAAADKQARKSKALDASLRPLNIEEEESDAKAKARHRQAEEAARTHRAHMDRMVKLEEDLAKKQGDNQLKQLTAAEQIVALEQKRLALSEGLRGLRAGTEAELEQKIKIADVDKDLIAAKKKQKADEERELGQFKLARGPGEVNALQRIGLFLGNYNQSPEMAVLDVSKKSERHLDAIRKALEARGMNLKGADDTEFD